MRIAFVKYCGGASGGCEKYLQSFAIIAKNAGHDVTYFYTNRAPETPNHPDNDDMCLGILKLMGVKLVKINVKSHSQLKWDSDFFEKFNEDDFDVVHSAIGGAEEYPFNQIKRTKIIHTIHGTKAHNQSNIHNNVLLCEWQKDKWQKNGGSGNYTIIPSIVNVPYKTHSNFREELGICNKFVFGMHQRNCQSLFSQLPFRAFERFQDDCVFLMMGGSDITRDYVARTGLRNVHFLDHSSDTAIIHKFLQTLDCYTHAKPFGEVCSACIIEAMYHGLPIISHDSNIDRGQIEMLEGCGYIAKSINDYSEEMAKCLHDKSYREERIRATFLKYIDKYSFYLVKTKIEKLYDSILL